MQSKKTVSTTAQINKSTTQQRIGGNTAHGYATQQFLKHIRAVLQHNLVKSGLAGTYTNRKGVVVQSTKAKPVTKVVQPQVYNYFAKSLIPQIIHQNHNNRNVTFKGLTFAQHGVKIGKHSKVTQSMASWLANNVHVNTNGLPLPTNYKFTALLPKHKPLK